jgi:hypothetical protein
MRIPRFAAPAAVLLALALAPAAQAQQRPQNPQSHMMAATNPQSTLRHLAIQQELFFARHGRYSARLDSIGLDVPRGVQVRVTLTPRGYQAVAVQGQSECVFYTGDARAPRPYARRADKIECRR